MLLYQLPFRMDKAGMNSSKCKGDAVSIWIDRRVYLACNIPVQFVVQLTSTELFLVLFASRCPASVDCLPVSFHSSSA